MGLYHPGYSPSHHDNHYSGKIPEFKSQSLIVVTLKQNQREGPIPKSLLNQQNLGFLLLLQNKLNGTSPQCLGEITEHYWKPTQRHQLHGNKLEGKVPRSLINCKYLELLDLGDNELNDIFPKWLGTLPNLKPLSLKSNKLHGPIKASKNKKLFAQLQIMDLSSNLFSGNLPVNIFENFQAMKLFYENVRDPWYVGDQYGYIPSIIGDLTVLCTLNLSHNHLEGLIPASLHQLSVIESLDLSFNKIGGGILQQLGFLTSLEALNLSHNHLVGCIPKGKQYDTFEKSSYQGNDGLHGFPLSKDCGAYERIAISNMISKRKNKMNTQIYLENFDGKKHR
ncbi:hypothetical protein P3S68_011706 [Capsicum galapagoense]